MRATLRAIFAGYVLFLVTFVVFLIVTRYRSAPIPSAKRVIATVVVGLLLGLWAGRVTARRAPQAPVGHTVLLCLALMLTGLGVFMLGGGVTWAQILTMFVFAPATIAAGMLSATGSDEVDRARLEMRR